MKEYKEQQSFVSWLKTIHPDISFFHIPNGENRDACTGAKLKRMGVMKGVPDLYILNYHLFIEMKSKTGGKLSKHQIEFAKRIKETDHYYFTANGFQEAVLKFNRFVSDHSFPTTKIESCNKE